MIGRVHLLTHQEEAEAARAQEVGFNILWKVGIIVETKPEEEAVFPLHQFGYVQLLFSGRSGGRCGVLSLGNSRKQG